MFLEPRRLHQLPPFSAETVELVRGSCARLPTEPIELTREFYRQLFMMAPQTRAMFPPDMTEQNDRLLKALLAAVEGLDEPERVEGQLRRWGVAHRVAHGVTNEMYVFVGHALVRALSLLFGYLETSVASAWISVYEWMAAVMIDGVEAAERAAAGLALAGPGDARPWQQHPEGNPLLSDPLDLDGVTRQEAPAGAAHHDWPEARGRYANQL